MSGILSIGGGGDTGFYSFPLEQSIRFNDGDNPRFTRTPSSTSNRQKFVWSGWIKRGDLGSGQGIFGTATGAATEFFIMQFTSSDTIFIQGASTPSSSLVENVRLGTSQVFRDVGAWYHIVLAVDTTQATASNRLKLYVNGDSITDFSSGNNTYPTTQNFNTPINNTSFPLAVGAIDTGTLDPFDGYMAEVNFVDGLSFFSDTSGTANTSFNINSFGETKNGIWIPKQYTGSYGTNGFRLTFEDDTTVEGFNTVLYNGTGATKSVGGVGFEPDLVWLKARDGTTNHQLFDSVRGVNKSLVSNGNGAEDTSSTNKLTSFDSDGFSLGSHATPNTSDKDYVAWCWQAGGAPTADNSAGAGATPTAGSVKIDGSNLGSALAGTIPATRLSANTTYGFSIVTYTANNGSHGTVGHGLSSAPELYINKNRSSGSSNWVVSYTFVDGTHDRLRLNLTSIADASSLALPTSTVFTSPMNNGDDAVTYCFHSVDGYSKIGSYTGTGSSGLSVTGLGFKPAWLMVKSATTSEGWQIIDNTREAASDEKQELLFANLSNIETTMSGNVEFTNDGFDLNTAIGNFNTLNATYIYMAFADTRDYAFWTDQSGNNNDFQHTNVEHTDIVPDTPTNNFATLNFLDKGNNVSLSNGNLVTDLVADDAVLSTIHFEIDGDESWYAEMLCQTTPNNNSALGIVISNNSDRLDDSGGASNTYWYFANGKKRSTGSETSYGATWTTGDIIGIAVSGGAVTFYKNNASQGQAFTGLTGSFSIAIGEFNGNGPALRINYGQDSSFGGLKIPQGNADANGNGDFFYAPPSNHLALCTDNLPNPGINPNAGESPDDYFNTVLYIGNQSVRTITGVGFQPDWIWAKRRSGTAESHILVDSVRGATITNKANSLNANGTNVNGITGFDADGFDLGTSTEPNTNSATYVAWNWKAGGTAVSNTDGTITSSVSASTESGFSIVGYTGTGSNATVGHGLTAAPDFVWIKNRDASSNQYIYTTPGGAGKQLTFEDNGSGSSPAFVTTSNKMTDVPSSTVLNLATSSAVNGSGNDMLAYCFHNVEGYSKVGTYEGNADADGAFVYTGFRPAWILLKRVDATAPWTIFDNKRDVDNVVEHILFNTSAVELAPYDRMDFVSNGFKLRDTGSGVNNADTILYLAFAEQPFKYANAR